MNNKSEEQEGIQTQEMESNKKKLFKQLFSKEFLMIYIAFCLYFLLVTMVEIGGDLFLTENGELGILSGLKIITTLSLAFLPLLVVRLNTKIGNIWVARFGFILLAISGVLIFINDQMIYLYLFTIPIVSRFFNSAINPYSIYKVKKNKSIQDNLSKFFSIRDFFLYLGCALGAFVGFIIKKRNSSYVYLFQASSFITLAILLIMFLGFKSKKIEKKVESENSRNNHKMKFKDIENQKYLIIFVLISCFSTFIGTLFFYLPTLAYFSGLETFKIFESYFIGYIVIAFLSIGLATFTSNSKKKKIFLFDLIFDVLPLSLILFSNGNLIIVSIAIIFFIGRDFVKPISLDYIYSLFKSDEIEYIWGILGTVPNFLLIGFSALIPLLLTWNWVIPIYIGIGISIVVTVIASKFLPTL